MSSFHFVMVQLDLHVEVYAFYNMCDIRTVILRWFLTVPPTSQPSQAHDIPFVGIVRDILLNDTFILFRVVNLAKPYGICSDIIS